MNVHAQVLRLRADSQAKMACEDNLDFMRKQPSSSVTAEHDPDYRELGRFPTRAEVEEFLAEYEEA